MYRLTQALRVAVIAVFMALGLLLISKGESSAELTTSTDGGPINIGFFYHGGSVSINGSSDRGADIIIKITSEGGHHTLRQKGKVGVLWMNVGTLKFAHVPSVYFLRSTRKLDDLLSAGEQLRNSLGYTALARESEIAPLKNPEEKERWFKEFLKYKEASKVYSVSSGNISLTPKDGQQQFHVEIHWPYQAPPGEYLVTSYAVKDGKVLEKAEDKVVVQQVGVIKSLAGMAKNNGAFYGFISVLVALGAGFGVGLIFRKGGGGH